MYIQLLQTWTSRQLLHKELSALIRKRSVGQIQRSDLLHIFTLKHNCCQFILNLTVRDSQIGKLRKIRHGKQLPDSFRIPVKTIVFHSNVKEQFLQVRKFCFRNLFYHILPQAAADDGQRLQIVMFDHS